MNRIESRIEEQGRDYLIARINTSIWFDPLLDQLKKDGWEKRGNINGSESWWMGDCLISVIYTRKNNE